jgi:hypothetical protein
MWWVMGVNGALSLVSIVFSILYVSNLKGLLKLNNRLKIIALERVFASNDKDSNWAEITPDGISVEMGRLVEQKKNLSTIHSNNLVASFIVEEIDESPQYSFMNQSNLSVSTIYIKEERQNLTNKDSVGSQDELPSGSWPHRGLNCKQRFEKSDVVAK